MTRALAISCVLLLWGCNLEQEQARKALRSEEAVMRAEGVSVLARSGDPKMAALLEPLLRDPSARVRRNVVAALGALGPKQYLGKIAGRLRDSDLEVRLAAVRVLGDSKHPRASRMLLPMLQDPSLVIRRAAARALERLGLSPRKQAEHVAATELSHQLKRLTLEDAQLRASAAREIGLAGHRKQLPVLVKLLADPSPLVVAQAARAAGMLGGDKAREALARLAKSTRALDRVAAAGGLGEMGDVKLLARLAADLDPAVRLAAFRELSLGAKEKKAAALPVLCKGLADREVKVAVRASMLAREVSAPCAPQVKKLLEEADALSGAGAATGVAVRPEEVRWLVTILSPMTRPAVNTALLRLSQALHGAWRKESVKWVDRAQWRQIAGGKVGTGGPAPLKPTKRRGLRKILARYPARIADDLSEDPLMPPRVSRELVVATIKALGGRLEALAWLAGLAGNGQGVVRVAALEALAAMGGKTAGAAAAAAVSANLSSPRAALRLAAARACMLLGVGAAAAALKMLQSKDFEVRAAGARCLGRRRHLAAVQPLLKLLKKEKQVAVIQALASIGDRRATQPMVALLQQDHHAERWNEREVVVASLGILGDPAAAASLERELAHPHWKVRLAAARALARAGRPASARPLSVCQADYHASIRRACAGAAKALGGSR